MGIFKKSKNSIDRCSFCNYKISPQEADNPFCPNCGERQPLEKRLAILSSQVKGSPDCAFSLVEAECPKCGCKNAFKYDCPYFCDIRCSECKTYISQVMKNQVIIPVANHSISVECPYCHSKNTKKISTTSKVGSVAVFGVFAVGKVTKQWHCNNCKSDF